MTRKEFDLMMSRAKNGETIHFSEADYKDICRFEYLDRRAKLLPMLRKYGESGDWEKMCSFVSLNYEVMPDAFSLYYLKMPAELRRDFAIECYMHNGDSIPGCRKAIRNLPKNGINELPSKYSSRDKIIVYRAGEEAVKLSPYRISWTLDKKVAEFFFHRNMGAHATHLYQGEIRPCDVIAYTNDRKEKEILQYNRVRKIKILR